MQQQHFVVSIRPVGYATIFPYFFVYSARQRRACARARTVPVVQPAIMVRWSGLTEPCRLRPVAILELTGVGRRSEILPFGGLGCNSCFALAPFRIYVLAPGGQWGFVRSRIFGICQIGRIGRLRVGANDYSPLRIETTSHAHSLCYQEKRSDVAVLPAERRFLRRRDCHPRIECGVAMTSTGFRLAPE